MTHIITTSKTVAATWQTHSVYHNNKVAPYFEGKVHGPLTTSMRDFTLLSRVIVFVQSGDICRTESELFSESVSKFELLNLCRRSLFMK